MHHGISRIQIKGYKSLKDVDLELRPLNVLIGANASGKSNFLSAFRMLNALTDQKLQAFIARQGGASAVLHYGPKATQQLSVALWFTPFDDVGLGLYRAELTLIPPDILVFGSEEMGLLAEDTPTRTIQGSSGQGESQFMARATSTGESPAGMKFFKSNLDRWRFYHFHDTSDTAPVKQNADLQDNRYLRADAGNLAAFLYMLKTAHPANYSQIRETIRLAFPLFDDFVTEPSRLNSNKILLTWRERGRDHEFGPHQLSDGTLRFMCLTALLLQPFDHPEAPYTVTIDEPELGLHPYAITLLASMLQSASRHVQVIVSTQSSALLGAIGDPSTVVVVDRRDGATTLERLVPENIAAWLEDYSLGDVWEKGVIGGGPHS